MAVPAVSGPFINVTAGPGVDPAGWPASAWVNIRLVEAAWSDPTNAARTILVVGGIEHRVAHTLAEVGQTLDLVS